MLGDQIIQIIFTARLYQLSSSLDIIVIKMSFLSLYKIFIFLV